MKFGFTEVEFITGGDLPFIKTTAYTVDPILGKMVEENSTYAPSIEQGAIDITNFVITEQE